MSKLYRMFVLFVLMMLMISCAAPATAQPAPSASPDATIVRHPEPDDYSGFNVYTEPPTYDPNSTEQWQMDLRSADLTKLDLSKSKDDLLHADFDSKTKWPSAEKMPTDFDWQKIMEIGKDPGLGIRELHQQGIDGNGVAIAIIDQPLLVDHVEYKDRIRLYEEINITPDSRAAMHGAAVTSIAVGKTVGVAPKADLYYIGSWTGDWGVGTNNFTWNFTYYAQAIRRILEINKDLPEGHKIRVIAMQVGWSPDQAGYDEITAAVNEAKAEGIFIVSSSLSDIYGLHFQGLGKLPTSDPNNFELYLPGSWWEKDYYYEGMPLKDTLLIPMDSRTTASPNGTEDYVFYREGGWSWSIPYIAGVYALAAQVEPNITPEQFWETALKTGKTIQLQYDGKEYEFGVILDPQALIAALKSE